MWAERRFGKNNVFQGQLGSMIEGLKRNGHAPLAGKLTALRGDMTVSPSWNPVSMSIEEINKDRWSAKKMESLYGGLAKASKRTPVGKLAKQMEEIYSNHVKRLEKEINRRKRFEYY